MLEGLGIRKTFFLGGSAVEALEDVDDMLSGRVDPLHGLFNLATDVSAFRYLRAILPAHGEPWPEELELADIAHHISGKPPCTNTNQLYARAMSRLAGEMGTSLG